jgi:hypothetical protein
MNEGKLLQADWENFTREELLAELTRLQGEIARLTALLPATLQAQAKPVRVARNEPSPALRNTGAPVLSPEQKVQLFRRLFRGRADVYLYAGKAAIPENPATRRRAPTNGAPGSAKSPASGAPTAGIVYC